MSHWPERSGGQGVHREVESEKFEEKHRAVIREESVMNRLAKDGARLSLHYGDEGTLIPPSNQGVCELHGVEDQCVPPGGLMGFLGGAKISNSISREAKRGARSYKQSDDRITLKYGENHMTRSGGCVSQGSKKQGSKRVKFMARISSLSEKPRSDKPRRLADWLNPTGAKKVHSLVDKIYKAVQNREM